jgi:hypothetical protein
VSRELRAAIDGIAYVSADSDPTFDDLYEHLREHPALYARLVERSQLATPWYGHRLEDLPVVFWSRNDVRTGERLAEVRRSGDRFYVLLGTVEIGRLVRQMGTHPSAEQAMAFADHEIAAAGWVLDGGTP